MSVVTDTTMLVGPCVARTLAGLNDNLVIGTPADGWADELRSLGAEVAVVTGIEDLSQPDAMSGVNGLQAVLAPLRDWGYGQVLIVTSASGRRQVADAMACSATGVGANLISRCAALTAAAKGVCVNALGTNFMNYPGFDSTGASGPDTRRLIEAYIPLGRLGEPSPAAHFAVSLLDGHKMHQTSNVFLVSGGFNVL